jgi:DNA-binding NarL/FixJ family response regulator
MMSRPRLLLADDHLETVELLRALLQPEFEVIGHVTDGRTLVRHACRLSPDVIVTDISMPEVDGLTAASEILHRNPKARIVFVTVHADHGMVARGMETGALGFVLKMSAGDDLVPAVRAALRGELYLSSTLHFEDQRAALRQSR